MRKMSPALQSYAGSNPERAYFGECPTLGALNRVYGGNTSQMWLIPHIVNISEFCGCREKLTDSMIADLASVISTEYFYLKASELMLFFHRFKTGRYGRFYGAVDPLVITSALRDFIGERADAIAVREQEQARQRYDDMMKNAAPKEFVEKHLKDNNSPLLRVIAKANNWEVQPPEEDEDKKIYDTAKSILGVVAMEKLFLEKYNCTPQDYITAYEQVQNEKGIDTEHPV